MPHFPDITDRDVDYPSRVKLVKTQEENIFDLEAAPGAVRDYGTDLDSDLFLDIKTYIDESDGLNQAATDSVSTDLAKANEKIEKLESHEKSLTRIATVNYSYSIAASMHHTGSATITVPTGYKPVAIAGYNLGSTNVFIVHLNITGSTINIVLRNFTSTATGNCTAQFTVLCVREYS